MNPDPDYGYDYDSADHLGRRRDRFGYALGLTLARAAVASPVMLLGLALCLTFIGIPLGFPILLGTSLWITRPIRRLPTMNYNNDSE